MSAQQHKASARAPGTSHEERWAMACYLGALLFWLLAPLAIYLAKRNSSTFIRSHAAQAFNLTLTATLFALSGGIAANGGTTGGGRRAREALLSRGAAA